VFFPFVVRSAKRVSNHERATRLLKAASLRSSFETRAAHVPQDERKKINRSWKECTCAFPVRGEERKARLEP
jgi:hypothetical protein